MAIWQTQDPGTQDPGNIGPWKHKERSRGGEGEEKEEVAIMSDGRKEWNTSFLYLLFLYLLYIFKNT
jgi:hypothetical protein